MNERLRLVGVDKHFGHHQVLNNLNFSVGFGEVLALLGDNGAGKSTLIKIIAGYHQPSAGKLYWENEPINDAHYDPQQARALGIQTVYQHLGLVDQLSIARNFFLGAEPTHQWGPFKWLKREYMREIVRGELNKMGIKRKLDPDDSVSMLSGGERQAIAISRARFFGAKLLILDEPTSALSLRQTEEVLDYIKQAAASGISVIFITHTLHHIERIVDKITILHHGHCVGNYDAGAISIADCADLIVHGAGMKQIIDERSL
jgi:simple sugar transport system ATP-binding protein